MLVKPTHNLVKALHILTRTQAWPEVDKALERELQATYAGMKDAADIVTLHQLQGRARAIGDIQKLLKDSDKILERYERNKL